MQDRDDAWKSIVAGAVAGLAASWVMNRYQELQSQAVTRIRQSRQNPGERAVEQGRDAALGRDRQVGPEASANQADDQKEDQRPSTVKLAEVISIAVARHRLTEREKRIAEPIVHYAFGTLMGAWYGVLAAVTPLTSTGRGTLYGAAVWLGADEISLAALGLAKDPRQYPLSSHASALAAHVVYGFSLDTLHGALLKAMGADALHSRGLESSSRQASRFDLSRVHDLLSPPSTRDLKEHARSAYRDAFKKAYRAAKKRAA